jgi:hypothetical protein
MWEPFARALRAILHCWHAVCYGILTVSGLFDDLILRMGIQKEQLKTIPTPVLLPKIISLVGPDVVR